MEILESGIDCQVLSEDELMAVEGGKSAAYYIGYAGGQAASFFHGVFDGFFGID